MGGLCELKADMCKFVHIIQEFSSGDEGKYVYMHVCTVCIHVCIICMCVCLCERLCVFVCETERE